MDRVHERRVTRLVESQFRTFRSLFKRALTEENVDVVHDLRVCTRRLQQCFDGLHPNPPRDVRRGRRLLRRVRHALGEWRNCDVTLQLLERRGAGERVRQRVEARRRHAIAAARRRLAREDLHRLESAVRECVARCGSADDLPSAARLSVRRAREEWIAALSSAEACPSAAKLHELRIATKRLRYRMELARDVGEREAAEALPWLEKLQETIGRWHDRHILRGMIRGSDTHATNAVNQAESAELTRVFAVARAAPIDGRRFSATGQKTAAAL